MSERGDRGSLEDILEAIKRIEMFTKDMDQEDHRRSLAT